MQLSSIHSYIMERLLNGLDCSGWPRIPPWETLVMCLDNVRCGRLLFAHPAPGKILMQLQPSVKILKRLLHSFSFQLIAPVSCHLSCPLPACRRTRTSPFVPEMQKAVLCGLLLACLGAAAGASLAYKQHLHLFGAKAEKKARLKKANMNAAPCIAKLRVLEQQ